MPYANYALIVINVVIFLLQFHTGLGGHLVFRPWVRELMLTPRLPHVYQFLTYAFLHADFWHIFGNMFFLYLFGNNVNDKLGHIGYVSFYLAGAVFSGVGHALVSTSPVLGASGAVAAVTGAYLALFPKTVITIVYWLIFIGTMDVPAFWFIAFKLVIIDNIIAATGSNIAYNAHLAGYAFGAVAMLLLLMTRLLEPTEIDLWQVIRLWNRRREYRDVVSSGYNPFAGLRARRIRVREIKKTPEQRASAEKVESLRTEINRRIAEHNLPEAARAYLELVSIDGTQLPPRQYLLDIANQLASEGKAGEAAAAYEKFLAHYGNYEYVDQVELMLGLLYSRYLGNSQKAVEHLRAAEEKLSEPTQLRMCREELAKLRG